MSQPSDPQASDARADETAKAARKAANAALFADRNFRWLLTGGVISMLGDQFTLIAMPWLVMAITGDGTVLGTVLAVMSLPRAVFILLGGAIVDRYSPKTVLMLTKHANTVLLGLLAALVLTDTLTLPLLYPLVLAIGLASAFSIPSGSSILPRVVAADQLPAANGVLMGLRQLSMLAGPALSGLLIAVAGGGGDGRGLASARGLGWAFAFDCFSFVVSAWTLARVAPRPVPQSPHPNPGGREPVLAAIAAAMRHFRQDRALRAICLYFAAVSFIVGGPLQVALPVLTRTALGGDATTYSQLMTAHGVGTLLGMALSGARPGWRVGGLGTTILLADLVSGLLFLPLGLAHSLWQALPVLLLAGVLMGYLQVSVFSWMQRRVPSAMLGRAMSLFMFIFMGLAPLSAALAGVALDWLSAGLLFAVCGVVLAVLAGGTLLAGGLRPVREEADGGAVA